jgi:hypothetical protein
VSSRAPEAMSLILDENPHGGTTPRATTTAITDDSLSHFVFGSVSTELVEPAVRHELTIGFTLLAAEIHLQSNGEGEAIDAIEVALEYNGHEPILWKFLDF